MEGLKSQFLELAEEYYILSVEGKDEQAKEVAEDMRIIRMRARALYLSEHKK